MTTAAPTASAPIDLKVDSEPLDLRSDPDVSLLYIFGLLERAKRLSADDDAVPMPSGVLLTYVQFDSVYTERRDFCLYFKKAQRERGDEPARSPFGAGLVISGVPCRIVPRD